MVYSIRHLPLSDRPRERLKQFGVESLSLVELIAVILGSGTKSSPVLQLAQEIVARFQTLPQLTEATLEELCTIKGIGLAKAIQLKASLALGARVSKENVSLKYRIDHPLHVYQYMKDRLSHEKREFFIALLLDTKGCLICQETISIGTLSESLVHPREVFYPAIRHKAASLVVVHNHPSGDPTPSREDLEVTRQLVEVGNVMQIPLNDHIIIGHGEYCSLRQKNAGLFVG